MKPKPTPEQIRQACREHCERIPNFSKLPESEQNRILRALWEIAQE